MRKFLRKLFRREKRFTHFDIETGGPYGNRFITIWDSKTKEWKFLPFDRKDGTIAE